MEKLKAFFEYFFGKGDDVEFVAFGLAHFLPIMITAAIIIMNAIT